MELKYREAGSFLIIDLEGEITATNSMKLREEIKSLISRIGKNLLINLANITYIDSTGLGLLVAIHATMKRNQAKMGLIGVNNPEIIKLLQITQLNNFFKIYESELLIQEGPCN